MPNLEELGFGRSGILLCDLMLLVLVKPTGVYVYAIISVGVIFLLLKVACYSHYLRLLRMHVASRCLFCHLKTLNMYVHCNNEHKAKEYHLT